MHQKDKILELKAKGLSYRQIQKETGASKGTISFHCGAGQKEKYKNRNTKHKSQHPYVRKYYQFVDQNKGKLKPENNNYGKWTAESGFKWTDVLEKFGDSPVCYLCGDDIDIHETNSYAFDHIIPFSKDGSCTLENLGIACFFCNQSKSCLNPEEYYTHCKKVLENHGYIISIKSSIKESNLSLPPSC